jgi:membrane protein YdbS with pleckstrin-like domain
MIIRNTRYEDVRQATRLERRISDIERLVGFLVDMMLGLISAFFAIVGAAFIDGGANWKHTICAGVLAFLISMWVTNFLFRTRRDGV